MSRRATMAVAGALVAPTVTVVAGAGAAPRDPGSRLRMPRDSAWLTPKHATGALSAPRHRGADLPQPEKVRTRQQTSGGPTAAPGGCAAAPRLGPGASTAASQSSRPDRLARATPRNDRSFLRALIADALSGTTGSSRCAP